MRSAVRVYFSQSSEVDLAIGRENCIRMRNEDEIAKSVHHFNASCESAQIIIYRNPGYVEQEESY